MSELSYSEVVSIIENYMRELEAVMDESESVNCIQFIKANQRHQACNIILDQFKTQIKQNYLLSK